MKGPGLRIDMDVRRIWRCAKCGKTARTSGFVTAQRCGCSDESPWMRLEQPVPKPPFQPPHRDPIPEYDDEPAPPAAPSDPPEPTPAAELAPAQSEVAIADAPTAEVAVVEAQAAVEVTVVDVPALPVDSPLPDAPAEATPTDEFGAGLPDPLPGN